MVHWEKRNLNGIRASLTSTKECLEEIQEVLLEIGIGKTTLQRVSENQKTWRMHLYKGAYDFLNYIYNDKFSKIYLDRKYSQFKKFKDERK